MTYQSFQKKLEEMIVEKLPEGYRTEIHLVVKNNDLQLDSLIILSEQSTISPNFYLQQYYEKYLQGNTMEALTDEILDIYRNTRQTMDQYPMDLSLDHCRDRIIYHLTSGEKNNLRLEQVPSIPFLDMVITFHILMMEEEEGVGSIMVRDVLQSEWGISTKQLFQLAEENTTRLFPMQIHSMDQMLSELQKIYPELAEEYPENSLNWQGEPEPLVLTNHKGINGAAVMLYPGCLGEIEKHCAGDFYILPSSVHELLIMPDVKGMTKSELLRMVREVNENCVQPDEILSDHVYHYSSELQTVEIC